MKILEDNYLLVNPPKTPFLGAHIKHYFDNCWNIEDMYIGYVPHNFEAMQEDWSFYDHIIAEDSIGLPSELKEKAVYSEGVYDVIYSKKDIEELIDKLTQLLQEMEDYEITEEMDNRYKEYSKDFEDNTIDYMRQRHNYHLISNH